MQKKKHHLIFLVPLLLFFLGILILNNNTAYADVSMVNPEIYEYSVNSTVGAWYDRTSGCYIYQTLDKKRVSDNYYQTSLLEFSRLKPEIDDPTTDIYKTDREASLGDNDPHYYEEVSSGNNKAQVIGDKYYDRQYISIDKERIPQYEDDPVIDGKVYKYITYVIDQEFLLTTIEKYYPDWYEELQEKQESGKEAWIGIDCVMRIHYPELKIANFDGGWTGLCYSQKSTGETNGAGEYYRWSNWEDIDEYIPGRLGSFETGAGIYTHYNNYLNVDTDIKVDAPSLPGSGEPSVTITDEIIDEETIVKDSLNANVEKGIKYNQSYDVYGAPHTYTYNTSDEFDLGVAIPSTETYTNGVDISNWYGSIGVEKHEITLQLQIPYVIVSAEEGSIEKTVRVRTTEPVSSGEHDGLTYPDSYTEKDGDYYYYDCTYYCNDTKINYFTGAYIYEQKAYYYSLSDINMYQHDFTTVSNDFSSLTYDASSIIPYSVTINGENKKNGSLFDSTTFVANTNKHIMVPDDFYEADAVIMRVTDTIESSTEAYEYVEDMLESYYDEKVIATYNDTLNLNNVMYMDESNIYYISDPESHIYTIGASENDTTIATQNVTIPAETQNGEYYTYQRSEYSQMIAGHSSNTIRLHGRTDNKEGIAENYRHNEPIQVHTPVISPISIKGEEKTQLVDSALSVHDTQLILDTTYTLSFDWETYFHYKGYTKNNFANYVKSKEIRFPFDVIVNGVSYKTYDSIGYTEWIDIGNVESIEFYIPSWAEENVYGSETFDKSLLQRVQARVYAVNYINDEREKWQEDANTNRANYVATYDYPVQVSGILYGFKIVSVNDTSLYEDDFLGRTVYNYVENLCEKINGTKNRLGLPNIRYTLNGEINNAWEEENTLPPGKNNTPMFSCGHTFGFSLKSIANLNGTDDSIHIVPNYRYVTKDGEIKEVSVYYEKAGKVQSIYDDTHYNKTYIGSKYFNRCHYDYSIYNPVIFTALAKETSKNDILYRKSECSSAGDIILPSTLSLLTGNEEELAVNEANSSANALRYNTSNGLENIGSDTYKEFESSMQTWYGTYTIPDKIYVCEKTENGSDAFLDLMEEEGVCSPDSDIWLEDGFLILNFDITSLNEGIEHLSYYGSASNMWSTEKGNTDDTTKITYYDPLTNEEITIEIPLKDGDIAIIDMSKQLSDKYSIGILYIN